MMFLSFLVLPYWAWGLKKRHTNGSDRESILDDGGK